VRFKTTLNKSLTRCGRFDSKRRLFQTFGTV